MGVLALVLSGGFASYGVEIVSFQCWWAVSGGHYSLVLLVCLGSWGGGGGFDGGGVVIDWVV